ncbi:uncharacterized protein [Haliotis cracherodii]|uniref:uncharacterized protein n=1 Tax=Haliotis cracherodii TaxID=6455 RepID=UPI0039E73C6B
MQPADRLFYSIPKSERKTGDVAGGLTNSLNSAKLLETVRNSVIGRNKVFSGPFGLREVTYLDYIASGRALSFIEDYIRSEVLPEYGNTHTTTSVTSLQTTLYRHEARDIIRNAVHASEHDSVIFVGSGCTGAVHKLIHALNLQKPPVVFVGPYEHHSILLPWKETGAEVVRIKLTGSGLVDCRHLENQLKKWKSKGRQLIGCFSAASNITGILTDVNRITICLHKHGALAFWDYATAAPYVRIDMNPVVPGSDQLYVYKDAVFISPHKFVGGAATPGVLIAKKSLFQSVAPEGGGGGSVFYVRRDSHRYLQEPEMREEGGTPPIVESVRAGLVFQLKEAVTPEVIMQREQELCRLAVESLSSCDNLIILGNQDAPRLPIFSFLVYNPTTGRFLHHNFVSTILNDVFGIQARGGCACAGPYAMDLLGLDEVTAEKIEKLLVEDSRLDRTHLRRYREYSHREILRPGFTRLNLPYFLDDACLDFVMEAIKMVADHAWKLLPQYIFNPETGEWRQKSFQVFRDRRWLGHISYVTGEMKYKVPPPFVKGPLPSGYEDCLEKARAVFKQAEKPRAQLPDQTLLFDDQSRLYRWFMLPSEALDCVHGNRVTQVAPSDLPFLPPPLKNRLGLTNGREEPNSDELEDDENILGCEDQSNINSEIIPAFSEGMVECLERGFEDGAPVNKIQLTDNEPQLSAENISGATSTSDSVATGSLIEESAAEVDKETKVPSTQGDRSLPAMSSSKSGETSDTEKNQGENKQLNHSFPSPLIASQQESVNAACKDIEGSGQQRGSVEGSVCPLVCPRPVKTAPAAGAEGGELPKCKWFSPPKTIFKATVKAVEEHNMIHDGDRLLVCLSGGKDSLSLLHTIRQYQFYCKGQGVHFEFGAVTVDPQTPAYDPSPLKQYLKVLGVPYFYESQCILETAENLPDGCASICSFCSRMKRGRIYAAARREGYNVLALGQHLDDLAESFLMSFFHNGVIRTMKAHYTVQDGDLRVIRPFVFVREKELRNFAEKNKLPVIAENCPACFEAPKERHRTKQLLASQELLFPHLYNSIMAAMKPVMAISRTGRSFTQAAAKEGDEEEEEDIDAV